VARRLVRHYVATSSSDAHDSGFPKRLSLSVPESLGPRSPASSEEPLPTSASTSSNDSQGRSVFPSPSSSLRVATLARTTRNSLDVPPLPMMSSSTQGYYSRRSMKRRHAKSSDTPEPDVHLWRVEFHREVAKLVAKHDENSAAFRPTLRELLRELETNPKQFPKKRGALQHARAADVTYVDGITWRAVFTLDDDARAVRVLSLGPHDAAYDEAKRRS
jgi:mRNA-degrading endonuclease RelE of RelBE toxin-antitoxin system